MDMNLLVSLAILLLLAVIAGALLARPRRAQPAAQRFAPSASHAATGPAPRQDAVAKPEIAPLAAHEAQRYRMEWQGVQARFVHTPRTAVAEADLLARDVLMRRGYPVADLSNDASSACRDHPLVARNYRAAHAIAQRDLHGDVGTEDLRQALLHYRALFDVLLQAEPARRSRPEDSRAAKIRGGLVPPERALASDRASPRERERQRER